MVKLRDPQRCKHCGQKGIVVNVRTGKDDSFRRRRRECPTCRVDHHSGTTKPYRWNSFETVLDPRQIALKALER
jgi:transcriptional regulator NrdR family protein